MAASALQQLLCRLHAIPSTPGFSAEDNCIQAEDYCIQAKKLQLKKSKKLVYNNTAAAACRLPYLLVVEASDVHLP